MSRVTRLVAVLMAVAVATPGRAATACNEREICGLANPEDMIVLTPERWVLASSLAAHSGGLYVIDMPRGAAAPLAPDVSQPAEPIYSGCPGPPEHLVTHGLSVRFRSGAPERLYVINHAGRQSVEVFDISVGTRGVALVWRGCVVIPPDASANAVAALPDGFAITSFSGTGPDADAELLAGRATGFVERWSPRAGWRRVPGSEFAGDNGLFASGDGHTLYVNGWSDGVLYVLDLTRPDRPAVRVALGRFHPDNIRLGPEGELLIAGQVGGVADILNCHPGACLAGSRVVAIDTGTLKVTPLGQLSPRPDFAAASTAIRFQDHLWLSSFLGDRIIQLN